jgi:hypothetical protein
MKIQLQKQAYSTPHLSANVLLIFRYKWLPILLLIITMMGCKKVAEEVGTIGICPEVASTNPASAATAVGVGTTINVSFNEPIDPASVTATTFVVMQGTTPIAGVLTYSGVTATFTPTVLLKPFTIYTTTLTTGIRDMARNAMISDYVFSFTTGPGPDITSPTVTSTDPENAAIGVSLNKKISATFSEVMDSLSTTTGFTLANTTVGSVNVSGSVIYSGTTAVFSPNSALAANNTYTATISASTKDFAGNNMTGNYTWSFTTGVSSDNTAPEVISTIPVNNASAVVLNTKVTAVFSEFMDPSSINSTSFTLKQGTTVIAGLVTYSVNSANFSPLVNLTPGTLYTATITTGAKDLAGNALQNDYTWSFTTGTGLDATAPTILTTDPERNATNVSFNKKVSIVFSEAMDPLSINTATVHLRNGNILITGTVSYNGNNAIFSPTVNLNAETIYTATVTTGVRDLGGNAMAANYTWNFTTAKEPDVKAPTVILTDPISNAINVPINKNPTATFSEVMNAASAITSFTVREGSTLVPGITTYSGRTVTFSPTGNLKNSTLYTATVSTAARDTSGNALANDYTWSFTTVPPTVPIQNLGSASDFGAFGGSAGITNQGTKTVINGSISTTAASTLVTGFHEGNSDDIYTETTLNRGNVTGRIYAGPPAPGSPTSLIIAVKALEDATIAYNNTSPAAKPGGTDPGAGELGGLTLIPGIYKAAGGTFKISNGNLVLDARGDPNATWLFQTEAGLTVGITGTSGARSVLLINGAQAKNVFWHVGSAATINGAGGGVMVGSIVSRAGITISTVGNTVITTINGRAISLVASVTMVNTVINVQ